MGIVKNYLVLAVIAGFSAGAAAVPLIKPGCQQTGYNKSFQDLIHKVNIVGPTDDRDTLANVVKKEQLNLTFQQQLELSKSMGYVFCPGVDYGNGTRNRSIGTAFVAGQSDIVITAAHNIYDEQGRPRFKSLSDCYFLSHDPANWAKIRQKEAPDRVYLPSDSSNYIFGTTNTGSAMGDRTQDYALIRLERPLNNVKPLALIDSVETLQVGQPLLVVSAAQKGVKTPNTAPVAAYCQGRDYIHSGPSQRAANFYSDCDSSGGASGSPAIVEIQKGKWAVAGILVASGFEDMDYEPYKRQGANVVSGSRFVALDQPLVKKIQSLSRNGDLHIATQPTTTSTSIFIPTSAEK